MTRSGKSSIEAPLVVWAIAGFGPIAVAGALVPLREELVRTNLALILVVVVVLAAIAGGRGAGIVAAVVAAMSYDFFLTRPYLSLRIDDADDIETAAILLAIGLIVGQMVVVARRGRHAAAKGSAEVARLHRVAEQAAEGASIDDLIRSVETELKELLGLRSCAFERGETTVPTRPRLERSGVISGIHQRRLVGEEFALPADGVELLVLGRAREFGHFVLMPDPDEGASLEERIVAVALSDQLGAALAADSGTLSTRDEV